MRMSVWVSVYVSVWLHVRKKKLSDGFFLLTYTLTHTHTRIHNYPHTHWHIHSHTHSPTLLTHTHSYTFIFISGQPTIFFWPVIFFMFLICTQVFLTGFFQSHFLIFFLSTWWIVWQPNWAAILSHCSKRLKICI